MPSRLLSTDQGRAGETRKTQGRLKPHQPSEKQLQLLDALLLGAGPFFLSNRQRFFDLAIAGASRISAAEPLGIDVS